MTMGFASNEVKVEGGPGQIILGSLVAVTIICHAMYHGVAGHMSNDA
jgi:hypothetical protein